MASSSNPVPVADDVEDDEFDWEAAVREIDIACAQSKTTVNHQEVGPSKKIFGGPSSSSSSRQSTLERFLGIGSNLGDNRRRETGKQKIENFANGFVGNSYRGVEQGVDAEEIPSFVKIDPEAAKTWIYPVSEKAPRREYQFNITQTALFCNTLVALPTGLGKTFIAAVVMYNYFRWFPEGKIVFAAPSRPLVMQQIEACHKFVGIPQEWTIDLTGQTSPAKRASHWKSKRVFFVTPQVLEKDIFSGSCLVKHLVCLVIDEAHRATGNYSYCVVLRELMSVPVPLRILALTATPGSKQQTIQHIIDNLQISTLEYRNESDTDVKPYVHDRKLELIKVPMGKDAVEIDKLILDVIHPYVTRLFQLGILPNRDFQTLSPCDILTSRDRFRQQPPPDLPHARYGELEGYFGVLVTLYHIRKLLSSHGIKPAFEMLDEKLHQGSFARLMSRNEALLKAKLLMQQNMSHGAPSPKLSKMLEVLVDHFKIKDSLNSRVIIFSNFRGSVRDIMNALRNIQEYVKATEFIGQSSGKSLKGQSQKVQQAVLEKFRAGGYNVIVATSIGEEGLDIMEVDLVICFDANISPLRMIQRMGRTGRKHEGRVVVLACEGSELRGYLRKQANSKVMNKHLRNGGTASFNFHSSPRMIPHVYKPEVQVAELSIQQFVPRTKKVFEDQSMETSSYMTKLTDSESHLVARYFNSSQEDAWRPSLIAFPHFQAFPSRVHRVVHSFRTRMLIDAMQLLQEVSYSRDRKDLDIVDRACSDQQAIEAVKPSSKHSKGQLHAGCSDMNVCSNVAVDYKGDGLKSNEENMAEGKSEGSDCRRRSRTDSFTHAFLFDSGYVSVDCLGKVEISSLPQFPQILFFQERCASPSKIGHSFGLIQDSVQFRDSVEANDLSVAQMEFNGDEVARSTTCNNITQPVKDLITNKAPSPVQFCMQNSSKECAPYDSPKLVHELCISPGEGEFSPRLTNYIESGVVPESPVNHADMPGAAEDGLMVPDLLSTPEAHTGLTEKSLQQNIAASNERETWTKKVPSVSKSVIHSPGTLVDDVAPVCKSNILPLEETRSQEEKLPDTCFPEDHQLSSGGMSESIEPKRKLKRLRNHGDLLRDRPPGCKNQKIARNLNFMSSCSGGNHLQIQGKRGKKQVLNGAKIFIEEEAEVSSDVSVSDDEEDQQETNSCDSFIDDKLHPTAANTQTEEGRVDMMAIYRRSLLSQSPLTRMVETSADVSSDSVAQRDESASISGGPSLQTPENILDSTARNKKSLCLISPKVTSHAMQCRTLSSSHEHGGAMENRKRKSSLYGDGYLPIHNLESEFQVHSKIPRQDSSMQVKIDRATETVSSIFDEPKVLENGNMFDEDHFFDAIDLDAIEEQAARLLRSKSEGPVQKQPINYEPGALNPDDVLCSPSFDLGV